MQRGKRLNFVVMIIALAFGLSFILYPSLPASIAVHWNIKGEADSYMSKQYGAFLIPILMLALFPLFLMIPRIDPLKKNIEKFSRYYENFVVLVFGFLLYVHGILLAKNIGYAFSILQAVSPALGILLFYSGVLLEKAKQNWFIGIRTPWTLSNRKVWKKTHKLGAKLFKASGALAFFGFFIEKYTWIFVVIPVLVSALICVVYSYFQYEKLHSKR